MSDELKELKRKTFDAIASATNKEDQALLMLMFSMLEMVASRMDEIASQLTVPAEIHHDHHEWVSSRMDIESGAKKGVLHIVIGVLDKVVWAALAAGATYLFNH